MALVAPTPQLLDELSHFFRLLSEPARLQLLCELKQGPRDVSSLIALTSFHAGYYEQTSNAFLKLETHEAVDAGRR